MVDVVDLIIFRSRDQKFASSQDRETVQPNTRRHTMMAPLHDAIKCGDEDRALSLIEGGASLNEKDEAGQTALHVAASRGALRTVQLSLQRGSDKDAVDEECRKPIEIAAAGGHADVVKALIESGAGTGGYMGKHGLVFDVLFGTASEQKRLQVLTTLVEFGVDVNSPGCLHVASSPAEINFLVDAGADVNARNEDAFTPLECFVDDMRPDLVNALLKRGADVDVVVSDVW